MEVYERIKRYIDYRSRFDSQYATLEEKLKDMVDGLILLRKDEEKTVKFYNEHKPSEFLRIEGMSIDVSGQELNEALREVLDSDILSFSYIYNHLCKEYSDMISPKRVKPFKMPRKEDIEFAVDYDIKDISDRLKGLAPEYEIRLCRQLITEMESRIGVSATLKAGLRNTLEARIILCEGGDDTQTPGFFDGLEEFRGATRITDKSGELCDYIAKTTDDRCGSYTTKAGVTRNVSVFAHRYIKSEYRRSLLKFLHDRFDSYDKVGSRMLSYLAAAKELGLLFAIPSYSDMKKEFPNVVGQSTYYNYFKTHNGSDRKDEIRQDLGL